MESSDCRRVEPTSKRVRFGVIGVVAAWVLHGALSVALAWSACGGVRASTFGLSSERARLTMLGASGLLLAVAVAAWLSSMDSWKSFDSRTHADRELTSGEFLAMAGMLAGTALVTGMVWAVIPMFIIEGCVSGR